MQKYKSIDEHKMDGNDKLAALKLPSPDFRSRKSISEATLQPSKNSMKNRHRRVTYDFRRSSTIQFHQNDDDQSVNELEEDEQGFTVEGDIDIINQTECSQDILCLCYTETFDYIAAGLPNGTIKMMNVNNGSFEFTLHDKEIVHNPGFTTAIKHRRVQTYYPITQTFTATYATGCVKCWHYPTGRCLYTIREDRETLGLFYHPRFGKFVTVGDDNILNLYNEETRTQERIFRSSNTASGNMKGHKSRALAACFHPKSNHEFISGGWDETIQFWDSRQAYATRQIMSGRICGDSLDISKNGQEILTCCCSKENPIQLWDYGSGKCITTIEPDIRSSNLYAGKYIDEFFVACGGCDENIFRIVDLRFHSTVALIKNLPGAVCSMDIGPNSKRTKQRFMFSDIPQLPKIAFCSGKTIFEIEIN